MGDSLIKNLNKSTDLKNIDLKKVLKDHFGFESFRGDQDEVIKSLLIKNHDSLLLMPTGMGKSLCYQMAALIQPHLVLVISPLVALMHDQNHKARKYKINSTYINSSLGKKDRETRMQSLKTGDYRLLFVTPERFKKTDFLDVIKNRKIGLLAVDEAHCISQWGHDFRPDYSRLGEIRKLLGQPVTLALTATATLAVQEDILKQLKMKDARIFSHGLERPNLHLYVHDVYGLDEKIRRIAVFKNEYKGSGIIYFSLIESLYKASRELNKINIPHLIYHGDQNSYEKKINQTKFIEGNNQLILATPAFGLGVDKPDVRWLVHAEVPGSLESYYQEIGRSGRDNADSFCHLLYDEDDVSIQMEFIKWANPESEYILKVLDLIQNHKDQVNQEGRAYLKNQMNYYNKRDYRLETSLKFLERWGFLKESHTATIGYEYVSEEAPAKESLKTLLRKDRDKIQNQKLLDLVQWIKMEEKCRWQELYKYFNHDSTPCGKCDLCEGLNEN